MVPQKAMKNIQKDIFEKVALKIATKDNNDARGKKAPKVQVSSPQLVKLLSDNFEVSTHGRPA